MIIHSFSSIRYGHQQVADLKTDSNQYIVTPRVPVCVRVAHIAADWDASKHTPAVLLSPPPDAHS